MVGNVNNSIAIPLFAIVYIISVFVVIVQHFSGFDFGIYGIICWIIVIIGAIGFILYVIGSASRQLGLV